MRNIKLSVLLTAATIAISGTAYAGKLVAPGASPLKAIKVQMAIKNPATKACPAKATMNIWIFTNKPGPVSYMMVKKGGSVSGPFTLQAKKGNNGVHMATFSKVYEMHQPFSAQYRVLIAGKNGAPNIMSNWVTMKASCKF